MSDETLPTDAASTQSVLIVDDHNETRKLLARFVAPLGVNVVEAANGRQALSLLKKHAFDAVISDLVMPKMSGLMLLHSMLEQGHPVPFILVTGYSDKDSAIQALRLGAFDYLEKPVNDVDLRSILEEALRVSRDQRQLLNAIDASRYSSVDANAQIMIMKMRALRFRGETLDDPVAKGNIGNWQDLKDMFVREAEPQLVFAEASLKDLMASENLGKDLAFALRVIQTVRMACESLRLNDMAEFAWSLEAALASFKPAPKELDGESLDLLIASCRILREKVVSLGREDVRLIQQRLDAVAAEHRRTKASA